MLWEFCLFLSQPPFDSGDVPPTRTESVRETQLRLILDGFLEIVCLFSKVKTDWRCFDGEMRTVFEVLFELQVRNACLRSFKVM